MSTENDRIRAIQELGAMARGEDPASIWGGYSGWLIGKVVQLPDPAEALVLSIENEFDDGTTLRYLTGPNAGELTQRDTFNVRRYEVLR